MDFGRDPGSGLFNRNELPQSYGTERAPLAPVPTKPDEAPPRTRAASVPRLAVEAKASTGSGLIDLDAVARSVEAKRRAAAANDAGAAAEPSVEHTPAGSAAGQAFGPSSLALAAAPVDVAVPPVVATPDSAPVPVGPDRRLLLTSIALLAVVGCLLGYLAIT